jgi:hypothetical protein
VHGVISSDRTIAVATFAHTMTGEKIQQTSWEAIHCFEKTSNAHTIRDRVVAAGLEGSA